MWKCAKCGERHQDHFSSCWKCAGMDAPPPRVTVAPPVEFVCAACTTGLQLAGSQTLRGENGAQNVLAAVLPNHERLDIYFCPRCSRVEFFAAAAGEAPPAEVPRVARGAENTAESLLREGNRAELQEQMLPAVACYEEVIARFPGTNYARDADERLRKIRTKLDL